MQCALNVVDVVSATVPPLELHINLDAIRVGVLRTRWLTRGRARGSWRWRWRTSGQSSRPAAVVTKTRVTVEAAEVMKRSQTQETENARLPSPHLIPRFDFECESESDEEIFYGYELLLSNASSSSDDDTSATHSRFPAFVFGYGSDGAGVFDYEAGNRLEEVVEGFTDDDECDEMTALLAAGRLAVPAPSRVCILFSLPAARFPSRASPLPSLRLHLNRTSSKWSGRLQIVAPRGTHTPT